jgi:oxygen-independent coproporphyrinogen-3 oxidase
MFGLLGQDLDIWQQTVTEAVRMEPEHLSLYGLNVEPGTPLDCQLEKVKSQLPGDDAQADMYEWAVDFLKGQGYRRYETSNFAREGYICRHNEGIWRGEGYIGLGSSAVSTIKGVRITNTCEMNVYIDGVFETEHFCADGTGTGECVCSGKTKSMSTPEGSFGTADFYTVEKLTMEQQMGEYMILGLRTARGVDKSEFYRKFGRDCEGVFGKVLAKYLDIGVLGTEGDRVFLNPGYFFVANVVLNNKQEIKTQAASLAKSQKIF